MSCISVVICYEHDITFNPILDNFKDSIPKSSLIVYDSTISKTLEQTLRNRPLLTDSFVVYFNSIPKDSIKIVKPFNSIALFVFKATPKTAEGLISDLLREDIKPSVIDNYNLSKDYVISCIMEKLDLTEALAKSIYSRSGKYIPRVIENIERLKLFPQVTRAVINRYVPKRSHIGYYDLLLHILTLKPQKPSSIYSLLYYYSKGHRSITKYLLDQIQVWLYVFEEMDRFSLTYTTADVWFEKSAIAKTMSKKEFKFIMNSFELVSLDYVYFLNIQLQEIYENFSEHRFLSFIGG